MNKKTKLIISISGVAILLAILLFVVKFIQEDSYRLQLPEYPDFQTVQKSLKEQILEVGRKTYWNPSEDNLGMLGMIYYSSAYYDKAKICYQLAMKKNSIKWIWNYYLGYLNLELGESKSSVENFRQVVERDPTNYLAFYYTGAAYLNLGLIVDAEHIFKRIGKLNDGDFIKMETTRANDFPLPTYALFRLARIYMDSNRLDSAKLTLIELIDKQINFGPAYRLLGNVYNREGNISLGNNYSVRANDLAEFTPPSDILIDKIALIARSDNYLLKQIDDAIRSGNFNWAIQLLNHSLKYNPDNKFLISKAIFGYFSMGFDKLALPFLDKHIKYFSDDFNELIELATVLFNKGFKAQSMNYFNQARKIKPDNSRLALWLLDRGNEEEAIRLLNEQLAKYPENEKILTNAVNMMLKLGFKEKAIEYLANLKNISPSNIDAKKLSGMILESEGKLKEALSAYEQSFSDNPKDIYIIKYLAKMYLKEKMWNKALIHFKLSLVVYPNEPFILNGLGNLLISCPDSNLTNVNEGREYAERAFINVHSTFETKISAGADLTIAYALLGDQRMASKYINLITNLAKNEPISQNYIPYFESLRKKYRISY